MIVLLLCPTLPPSSTDGALPAVPSWGQGSVRSLARGQEQEAGARGQETGARGKEQEAGGRSRGEGSLSSVRSREAGERVLESLRHRGETQELFV